MTLLVSDSIYDLTHSLPKIYLATFIGVVAIFIDFVIHDLRYNVFSVNVYIFLGIIISAIAYLYRTHKYVTDKDFLKEMLDNHSTSLLMSKDILQNTDNYEVTKLAKNIIQNNSDEIYIIKSILNKLENKQNYSKYGV